MLIIYAPIIVALIGEFVYGFATNPKTQECGRLLFAIGALVQLLNVTGAVVRR